MYMTNTVQNRQNKNNLSFFFLLFTKDNLNICVYIYIYFDDGLTAMMTSMIMDIPWMLLERTANL